MQRRFCLFLQLTQLYYCNCLTRLTIYSKTNQVTEPTASVNDWLYLNILQQLIFYLVKSMAELIRTMRIHEIVPIRMITGMPENKIISVIQIYKIENDRRLIEL